VKPLSKTKLLWKLFKTTFILSAFTFGGGYVIVPLMKKTFTDGLGWLSEEEMLELVSIGQSSPGAIAINSAVLVGYRMAGFSGALCGLAGTTLPPLIILSIVSAIYSYVRDNAYVNALMKGMQAGIAAVIADVVSGMAAGIIRTGSVFHMLIMACAFVATWFFNVNVAVIILISAALGAAYALYPRRKGGETK
jgi:chromate transporter